MGPILVFDIETCPKDLTDVDLMLLKHKLRNVEEGTKEYEDKKIQYLFRNPIYNKVILISTLWAPDDEARIEDTQKYMFYSKTDEKKIITDFMQYISTFIGRYVHFNGLSFDVAILLVKCAIYGIQPPFAFCNTIRFRTFPHYDIMQILTNWNQFSISLREALITFGIKDSKEILKEKKITDFVSTASDQEIQQYGDDEVSSTYLLFQEVFKIYK